MLIDIQVDWVHSIADVQTGGVFDLPLQIYGTFHTEQDF